MVCTARVWAPRTFNHLFGSFFNFPKMPSWLLPWSFIFQCTSLTSFRQLLYSKDFSASGFLSQRKGDGSPLPSPLGIVTHPVFSSLSLFGNVSSFLLNSLKLLTSMTDMCNIFHMLSSLWSVSSSRLSLMEGHASLLLLSLKSWEAPLVL